MSNSFSLSGMIKSIFGPSTKKRYHKRNKYYSRRKFYSKKYKYNKYNKYNKYKYMKGG
jgi:hypothetical protein